MELKKPPGHKKRSLENRGKVLVYSRLEEAMQKRVDEARIKEWQNYERFGAASCMTRQEAEKLIMEGAEVVPTQWIDVNKHAGLFDEMGNSLEEKLKSRLVARGDLQKIFGRTDSPTVDPEGVHLICSYASSYHLPIRCGDLDHGYFQGEPLSRPLLLKAPRGGIPGTLICEGDYFLAHVPIYGCKDAGRGLWKKVTRVMMQEAKLTENFIYQALYTYYENGKVLFMLGVHVDDLLWACDPSQEYRVDIIKNILTLGGNIQFQILWS